jgi:pimeloyl-ACP methyl ester carboxylesterase
MSRVFEGAGGNRLVATEMGAGDQSVLLLHGGGQTRHAWAKTARRLAEAGWRAIALDQRGHGDSAWVSDGSYAFPDYAADATAVARRIAAEHGGVKPIAIGASLGGIAALLALGGGGDPMFAGLVLVDIVPRMDAGGVAHIQGFMRTHAAEGFASVEQAAEAVAVYLPHRPRPQSLDGLEKNLRRHADGRWRWHWDPRFLDGPRSVNVGWDEAGRRLVEAAPAERTDAASARRRERTGHAGSGRGVPGAGSARRIHRRGRGPPHGGWRPQRRIRRRDRPLSWGLSRQRLDSG